MKLAVAFVCVCSISVSAQTNTAWPEDKRELANKLSYATVGVNLAGDIWHTVKTGYDRGEVWTAVGCEAGILGAANGISLLLKHFINEDRPNHVDQKSFPSEHTANAFAATGWRWQVSVPLALSTGYLRTAANWHWWHDVGAGAAIGLASRYGVTRLTACRPY